MVLPDEVCLLDGADIHQHHCALKIIDEYMVGRVINDGKQMLEQAVSLVGVAFGVEEDEGFAEVIVPGLIDTKLAVHHKAAKHQHCNEGPEKAVMARDPHKR